MSSARERILARLRSAALPPAEPLPDTGEAAWLARQPPLGDLAARFAAEQEQVGGRVVRVPDWAALPAAVAPWLAEHAVASVMTGTEPRLEPLRAHLGGQAGLEVLTYSDALETQREEIFAADCGITTALAAIAETGTVVLQPGPAEPRLLSLAVPVHLAVVEAATLVPTLSDFVATGRYQADPPTNLVFVSGASRTADIELTLTVGVHGPKVFLVALVG